MREDVEINLTLIAQYLVLNSTFLFSFWGNWIQHDTQLKKKEPLLDFRVIFFV